MNGIETPAAPNGWARTGPGRLLLPVMLVCLLWAAELQAGVKDGSFMNPISDVAWQEIFPLKVAGITLLKGSGNYDVPDGVKSPVCVCPAPPPLFFRIGIPVSFWEPARLIETVQTPFYFPFLGTGISTAATRNGFLTGKNHNLATPGQNESSTSAQAHFMIFPVWAMLELLTDFICVEHSGFDLAYLTEIDPLWQDDELAFIIQPEALLFANPFAQMACMADSTAVNTAPGRPLDPLFWCMGSGGSSYPLTGHVQDSKIVQANFTIAGRMLYKLSRELLTCDTAVNMCDCELSPIWNKSHYKLQPVRPTVRKKAYPIGKSEFVFGSGLNPPQRGGKGPSGEFLWLLFRKRVCCAF